LERVERDEGLGDRSATFMFGFIATTEVLMRTVLRENGIADRDRKRAAFAT
jgi:hypothetical protein